MNKNFEIAKRIHEKYNSVLVVLTPMQRIELDESYLTWIKSFYSDENKIIRINQTYPIICPLDSSLRQIIKGRISEKAFFYSQNNDRLDINQDINLYYEKYKNKDNFLYIKYLNI